MDVKTEAVAGITSGRGQRTGAPEAETRHGRVCGTTVNGVNVFRGIPYGGPTEGTGRFMPPRPPQPWTGVREARTTGPRCPQTPGNLFDAVIGDYFSGGRRDRMGLDDQHDSENCLVLNVLTPGLDGGKRPVMVYIHGGGFSAGSGVIGVVADDLPREEDVVLVSVNHRLNAFGYLYLGGLSERYAESGNIGQQDLILALEWVRDNIAAFGGDPGNVTIFGESGGGAKINTLMGTRAAEGLFHKAIVECGSLLRVATIDEATASAREVLTALGLDETQVDKLREVPAARLEEAVRRLPFDRIGPVVDGRTLLDQPWEPSAPANSAHVPMIVGTCKDEARWLLGSEDATLFDLDEAGMKKRLARMPALPADAVDVAIATYRTAHPAATPSDLLFLIASDLPLRANAIAQAERKMKQDEAPAFMFYFTYGPPIVDGRFQAFHTAELPLALRLVLYPESAQLSRQLAGAWAAFARTGNPSLPGLPWPAYALDTRPTMIFDGTSSHVTNDPDREVREFLQSLSRSDRFG
jgi:para-nitrobenzyl esterase